ncbi:MAG: SPOR domain-containing protein [Bacteroidales bacterium]|nr:SPOR domain-containing protein [Bacteroidales bacterium]
MKITDNLILLLVFFMLSIPAVSRAQEQVVIPEGYELVDSIVYRPAAAVDTTLAGKDIFMIMPSRNAGAKADVKVMQTDVVADAVRRQIRSNEDRTLSGYRVRIFFDNRQTARVESEETLKRFEALYHDVVAYRTYANPYFKVTVGDFRTKSEAMRLLERIKGEFPSAFVVKENISFPVVDTSNAYVVDTVKVLRPKVKS